MIVIYFPKTGYRGVYCTIATEMTSCVGFFGPSACVWMVPGSEA